MYARVDSICGDSVLSSKGSILTIGWGRDGLGSRGPFSRSGVSSLTSVINDAVVSRIVITSVGKVGKSVSEVRSIQSVRLSPLGADVVTCTTSL